MPKRQREKGVEAATLEALQVEFPDGLFFATDVSSAVPLAEIRALPARMRKAFVKALPRRGPMGALSEALGLLKRLRVLEFGFEGLSDIVGCAEGLAVFVEVKTKTGRLRQKQKQFGETVKRAGGVHVVAREEPAQTAGAVREDVNALRAALTSSPASRSSDSVTG